MYSSWWFPLPGDFNSVIFTTRTLWSKMSGLKIFHILAVTTLLLSSMLLRTEAQDTCAASSQPNPIAQQYANTPTGTYNATLAVLPIPLDTARSIIPSKYAILEDAYRSLLPSLPTDTYPVLMQAGLDHDIQLPAYNYSLPDFQVSNQSRLCRYGNTVLTDFSQRFGWSFPFIDLLGDGFSSFTWAPAQMISADNQIAIEGSMGYGTTVYATDFSPGCEAYGRLQNSSTYFSGKATNGSDKYVTLEFSALAQGLSSPFPVEFYQNVTNQPIFGNGSLCDKQIRLFNSSINQGDYAPVPVKGTVFSNLEPLDSMEGLGEVFGLLIDTPFIEYNFLGCESLKGYQGTGSGD